MRRAALALLVAVGAAGAASCSERSEDTAVVRVPLESGTFTVAGRAGADHYEKVGKRMVIDVDAGTVQIAFNDPDGGSRVESYRIVPHR